MLCWCPHPTLICTWATTPWLLPFVVVFCCCCCVLHCAQWLCRCASSYPCCCCAVLCACCVLERGKRERESDPNTEQSKGRKEEGIEKGKKIVPKWKARRHKRGLPIPSVLVASLFFQSTSANTQKRTEDTAEEEERRRRRERGRHTGWWSTRRKVSNHMGRWVAGMHTALSVTHKHTLHFALERGTRVIAHNITRSLSISPVHPSLPLLTVIHQQQAGWLAGCH